jgi:hypothetical protein
MGKAHGKLLKLLLLMCLWTYHRVLEMSWWVDQLHPFLEWLLQMLTGLKKLAVPWFKAMVSVFRVTMWR